MGAGHRLLKGVRISSCLAVILGCSMVVTACLGQSTNNAGLELPGGGDCSGAITAQAGELPLLISSPHGANRSHKLPGVADRQGFGIPQFVPLADQFTDEISFAVAAEIERLSGKKAYYVVAEMNRMQIDFNRPPEWSYEDRRLAPCHKRYHGAMSQFVGDIKQRWQYGLLVDIHGQSKLPKALIRGTRNGQTVSSMRQRFGEQSYLGDDSLFGYLRGEFSAVLPELQQRETLYSGGYIVKSYGSHNAGGIDAIQIEIGRHLRDTVHERRYLAKQLAAAILQQMTVIGLYE